ncbi:PhnD/SsuA/transferrin family substrate-binding protein [Methylomonas sp. AM2-LC]|uniref:PhnD/SsuA/transferrin family substrate-binding protein n=1 Tax=Methylomonas sp. AM2-LC TaxID=3153301 RepID=UPI003265C3BE
MKIQTITFNNDKPRPPRRLPMQKVWVGLLIMLCNVCVFAQEASTEQTFRLGYYLKSYPDHKYEDLQVAAHFMVEEIGKQIGIETSVIEFDNLDVMKQALADGNINFILSNSFVLVNYFDENEFAEGFKLNKSDSYYDSLIVLTRKNAGMDEVKSLQGKRLTLLENNQIIDAYMDVLAMQNFKKHYKTVFKVSNQESKSVQSILKLFFKQTDVVCVYHNFYKIAVDLNPQLNEQLQIIDHRDNIQQAIGFFSKSTPAEFRERVIEKVLMMNTLARGRQLFDLLKVDKAERATVDNLFETKKLVATYNSFKKSK